MVTLCSFVFLRYLLQQHLHFGATSILNIGTILYQKWVPLILKFDFLCLYLCRRLLLRRLTSLCRVLSYEFHPASLRFLNVPLFKASGLLPL